MAEDLLGEERQAESDDSRDIRINREQVSNAVGIRFYTLTQRPTEAEAFLRWVDVQQAKTDYAQIQAEQPQNFDLTKYEPHAINMLLSDQGDSKRYSRPLVAPRDLSGTDHGLTSVDAEVIEANEEIIRAQQNLEKVKEELDAGSAALTDSDEQTQYSLSLKKFNKYLLNPLYKVLWEEMELEDPVAGDAKREAVRKAEIMQTILPEFLKQKERLLENMPISEPAPQPKLSV